MSVNGNPSLHALLLERMAEAGVRSQQAVTVMSSHRDPYRMEKYRPEAEWLAESMERLGNRRIHVRGLHYAAIETRKPDGRLYENTEEAYLWMSDKPARAVRWLGLVPFTAIVDKKNDAPRVERFEPPDPTPHIQIADVEIFFPADLAPEVKLDDFRGTQPFKLVIFAEKASVDQVVLPLAEHYGVDAYLMAGEISDTHLYDMAAIGEEDGRPMVVLALSDADCAGRHMPTTIAYKIGALRDGWFPDLRFEVHQIGLTPEQVHEINATSDEPLPSSPFKPGEMRAIAWEREFGIKQVEIDSIATLRPDVLRKIVRDGIRPFYDSSLDERVREVRREWERAAQAVLEEQLGPEVIAEMRTDAEAKLAEVEEQVSELNDSLWIDTSRFLLPAPPEIPAARVYGNPYAMASSEMEWVEFVERLKARGAYAKEKRS